MKNHHEVGHFKNRLMIGLLSLVTILVMAGQSFAAMTCSSCHGMPPLDSADGSRVPSSGAFKGDHQKHMGAVATAAACTKCHGNSGYTNDHAAISGYMIQMKPFINSANNGTYSKTAPFAQSATPTLGSCSNVNCHFEKSGGAAPVWGTTTGMDCNSCHAKHIGTVALGAAITCSTCHPNYGASSFSHATSAGKHPIVVNATNNYGGAGVTSISWLPSQPNTYGTCSTYCHSNGTSPTGHTVATWGNTSTGCDFCHPNLTSGHAPHIGSLLTEISFYNYTSTKSSGTGYKFGCANCHPYTTASHINGSVETDLTANAAGGHLKVLNGAASINGSKQCLNVYCHSNGYKPGASYTFVTTPVWGGTFGATNRCAVCHGNSPNVGIVGSSAHSAHVVGIHYDDIFNGVSKKLPQGGGNTVNAAHGRNNRSTTINCNICHAATVFSFANDEGSICSGCHNGSTAPLKGNAAIGDTAKHVNGKVDVSFINQKIATKAQVVNSAFGAYTASASGGWARNKNIYKTYTSGFDVTKLALSAAPAYSVAGCAVACHSNIPVLWTATVSCTSCHTRLK
jgi:predicted CxxxxCH...CXXCH cytochrome family protein